MKQSSPLSPSAMADENESLVSQILLDLRTLMSLSESLSNFNWTCRKRRSCLDAPPPSIRRVTDGIEPAKEIKKTTTVAVARTTASPDTPLSFSPGESDDKSSKKRSRSEYNDMIRELNERKKLLQGEIENVKKHYHKLKTENSELKAAKDEVLNSCVRKDEETRMMEAPLTQHYRMNMVSHHPPLIGDPTVHRYGPITARLQSPNGLGAVNPRGRLGIDLNMPAEEVEACQPLDVIADRRARFAEARRKRRGIIKIKAMRNACGIKIPINR